MPGAEGTSGWGSSHFLSLLLVRVSLVSKGSAFRLRGSWLRNLHTTGHTQLMPPTTATLVSCCRSPQLPPPPLPVQHRERPRQLQALAPISAGKGGSTVPGSTENFSSIWGQEGGHASGQDTTRTPQHEEGSSTGHGGSYTDTPRHARGRHDDFLEQSQDEQLRRR